MLRSVAFIALAVRLSNPSVSEKTAERYGELMRPLAREQDFDPITMVSIVSHESAFNPRAVGRGVDIGLCQINVINLRECRGGTATASCQAAIERMKDPARNLRTCAQLITSTREFCRKYKRSRHAWFAEWLAQFQGRSPPGTYCLWKKHPTRLRRIGSAAKYKIAPHRYTTKVIDYRRCLLREIRRGARPGVKRGRYRFRCQGWYGPSRGA